MADTPLPPGSTIGILGGGQLGRMLSTAAAELGFNCSIYCEKPDAPAFETAASHICTPYDDLDAVEAFAKTCDVVTFEFENVPVEAAKAASRCTRLYPAVNALDVAQDRLREKEFMQSLGIAVAPFHAIDSLNDLKHAVNECGPDAMLKTRRLGYDGKGQQRLKGESDLETAFAALNGTPAIFEGFVSFDCEVSIVAVRGSDGDFKSYDLTENLHKDQILSESRVPARVDENCVVDAISIARKIGDALDYVGVFCVELFYCGADADAPLMVNEIAPRVHNSGHWTQDGCAISQFENHIRAIAGWPLGSTGRHSNAVMTNLIGDDCGKWPSLAADADVCLHLYGKKQARKGRKMGHYTRLSPLKA